MRLIFLPILICFFLYLYVLYYLTKDDFVIVRKDVSMEKVFNLTFLTSIVALFFSRLFYVLFNPSPAILTPLGFLAFPYFPGLSLIGGIIGASIFIYFYAKYRKLPAGKLFDLFCVSFASVLPVGFLITFIILLGKTSILFNALFASSLLLFFVFTKLILSFSSKGEIRDGSLGLIFVAIISFLYFIESLFINIKTFSFISLENITLLIALFASIVLLLNNEVMDKFLSKK